MRIVSKSRRKLAPPKSSPMLLRSSCFAVALGSFMTSKFLHTCRLVKLGNDIAVSPLFYSQHQDTLRIRRLFDLSPRPSPLSLLSLLLLFIAIIYSECERGRQVWTAGCGGGESGFVVPDTFSRKKQITIWTSLEFASGDQTLSTYL